MYKNYFYLNRLSIELNHSLKNFKLLEAFTQEKDKIILRFQENNIDKFLIISVKHGFPFILLKEEFHKAKKNTISFFEEYLPQQLEQVLIAEEDRIILFHFETANIYFFIKGKDTNIVFSNSETVIPFKKIDENKRADLLFDLNQEIYVEKYEIDAQILNENSIITGLPFVGKEIKNELQLRENNNISLIVNEIYNDEISIYYDEEKNKLRFFPSGFTFHAKSEIKRFKSYNSAINYFISNKYKIERESGLRNKIQKYIENKLSKIETKIYQIEQKLNSPSREDEFRNYGNLLLANLHLIQKGFTEIEVENFYDDNLDIKIKLDEKLLPEENAKRYFEKAKGESKSRSSLSDLLKDLDIKKEKLLSLQSKIENHNSITELSEISKELKLTNDQNKNQLQKDNFNFKHYIIESKYHVYVGKDSSNNDLLTTKFAKQNDIWFHARGVPGSHAILRIDNSKEVIPKSIIKCAASITAYHSKAKTAKIAPVAYTFKKFVVKRKGMAPGKVALLKEEVVLVKPEIPANTEFITSDEI